MFKFLPIPRLFSGVTLLLVAAPLIAADPPAATRPAPVANVLAANTVAHLDLPYASHDPAYNTLDLYAPKDAHMVPVIVFVHGGEWSRGDKNPVGSKPKFFNEHNMIFVSTNYRLSPAAPHPAQVNDVAEAIGWLHDHVADYGGDPNKIFLLGHSAGGHIVSYIALNPAPLAAVHLKPSDLKGVIIISGSGFDLVETAKINTMYSPYIKATFGDDLAAQSAASPSTYTANAPAAPPFLIGTTDDARAQASRDAAKKLLDAINAAGGKASATVLVGRTHRSAIDQLGAPGDQTADTLLDFIHSAAK